MIAHVPYKQARQWCMHACIYEHNDVNHSAVALQPFGRTCKSPSASMIRQILSSSLVPNTSARSSCLASVPLLTLLKTVVACRTSSMSFSLQTRQTLYSCDGYFMLLFGEADEAKLTRHFSSSELCSCSRQPQISCLSFCTSRLRRWSIAFDLHRNVVNALCTQRKLAHNGRADVGQPASISRGCNTETDWCGQQGQYL